VPQTMTAGEIARFLGGRLIGDGDVVIRGLAKIEEAGPGDLSFVANVKYVRFLGTTRASAVLVGPGAREAATTLIEVADPYADFLRLLEKFHAQRAWLSAGIHASAVVAPDSRLGAGVTVGALSFIGPRCVIGEGTVIFPHVVIAADVVIGSNCQIHSQVSLREEVRLGDRVIIHDGAVIGSDGFGFALEGGAYHKIPQLGRVVIGDDVEIGANTTIDRATLGETVIARGTKLDNLIQVAHNVVIGADTVIAAQTGISGSARIGDRCRIGGQVGFAGHQRLGDDVQVGAQAGVAGDVPSGEIISGSPGRPHALWKRIEASLTRLPDLFRRVRALEARIPGGTDKDRAET
jgi:UDP-3-O-[3-hydroxymyristoyl] glucosamine N-acyltransferase